MGYRVALLPAALILVTMPSAAASTSDPAPPLAYAEVRLAAVPEHVAASCRSIQERAHVPLLCPNLLPRATVGFPGLPPQSPYIGPLSNFFSRSIAGVDIGYSAPWEGRGWRAHRWRNRPCCFLHFDVFRRAPGAKAIPKGGRRVTLGGKRGLLVPAHEGAYYGSELYSANHVRFLWRDRGVDWVATLHTFGEKATERLLGRLIAHLRPAGSITAVGRGTSAGVTPNAIAAGGRSIWVASLGRLLGNGSGPAYGLVYRVDPSTAAITDRVNPRGSGGPHALALADGAVWVAAYNGVVRIDPRTATRVAFVNVGRFPKAIAAAAGRIWVTTTIPFGTNGWLVSIDPATNRRGRRIRLGGTPTAVAASAGALWVVDELRGTLTRVDPSPLRVLARIKVGWVPTAVAAGDRSVWVANTGDGTVSRVEARTNRLLATLRVGVAPRAIAVGAGAVWVATTGDGKVRRIDPATGRVTVVARGLVDPLALAVAHEAVWVATNEGRLVRIRLRD